MKQILVPVLALVAVITLGFADTFGNWQSKPNGSSGTLTITPGASHDTLTVPSSATVTFWKKKGSELVEQVPAPSYKMTPTQGNSGSSIVITAKTDFCPGTIVRISRIDSTGSEDLHHDWSN